MTQLKFFWNGIKGSNGKLQRCFFSDGALMSHPAGTLTIYSKEYSPFTADIKGHFKVENDSDMMADYFEKDRIRVVPSHPLYQQVLEARKAYEARLSAKAAKREERVAA